MEPPPSRLKDLLQVQLASDTNAVLHLPFILETLTKSDFLPSSHTQKWIARVNSLIHAKDPATKWSGLCLAYQTTVFSRQIMLECAQSWVGAAMPLLANQPAPTTKSAIRLLRLVFSSAMDVPEFQRQLCTPNVPKFASALVTLVEKATDSEVFLFAIDSLTHIVTLYPSLCRPMHGSLSNIALRHLNGSSPTPTPNELVETCSRLYAVLPMTGGKVNAPNLWRKSLDDTIAFAWGAFLRLRTTYPDRGYTYTAHSTPSAEDPAITVPLALDRLRTAVHVIKDILSTPTSRPVSLPVGALVRLCSTLLQCSVDEKSDANVDHAVRSLEASAIPTFWSCASGLLASLSQAGQHHVTPHLPTLLTHLAYHLEHSRIPAQTLQLLRTVLSLLANGAQLHDSIVASRLARSVMPLLAVVLSTRSSSVEDVPGAAQKRNKKGKKRVRGYEGDEVFKVGREIVCATAADGEVLLASVDVLESLLLRTPVTPPVHSIASRLSLSVYASLPQLPPVLLSPDLSLHSRLCAKLQRACVKFAIGTTSTMSQSLSLALRISDDIGGQTGDLAELLLHPRVPPLVRSLPHVEMLSLFRAEEGEEEIDTRTRVGLRLWDEPVGQPDVAERLTPHVEQSNTSNTPRNPPEAKRNTGLFTTAQEPTIDSMQVDNSPAPPPTIPPLQPPQSSQQSIELQAAPNPVTTRHVAQNPLPPPPDPSSSSALAPPLIVNSPPSVAMHVAPIAAPTREDDDDDEPMPSIDLGSDSESE